MDLGHTQIILSLIVGKGHARRIHEAKHIIFIVSQPFKKVSGFGAFQSSPSPLSVAFIRRWAFNIRFQQQIPVSFFECAAYGRYATFVKGTLSAEILVHKSAGFEKSKNHALPLNLTT